MTAENMVRIWPDPSPLDEDGLRSAYAPGPEPCVRVNFVSSLDGAVEVAGRSRPLSSDADRKVFAILRQHSDAVMVGAGTLRHEKYGPVKARRLTPGPEHPTLVVVSAALDLDPDDRAFTEAPVRPVVLTHAASPPERRAALKAVADVVLCGESVVDPATGLDELHRRGLRQVLCEGGPHLFDAFLAADLVDELCLTFSPLLAGAGAGRIVAGAGRAEPLEMRMAHLITAEGMLLARYTRA
jgi:riboflavin-specific deaminase-like protein